MSCSLKANQPNNNPDIIAQSNLLSPQNIFCFLKNEENPPSPLSSFFSENSLSQDIIKVTDAEPDICLEAFYALYHTLWPQINKQSSISLKDAWTNFIGGSILKGILSPPEKLVGKKKPIDIKKLLSQSEGEKQIFQDLDTVISSISHFRQKIINHSDQFLHQEEIIASLDLIEAFYQKYRDQVKTLGQALIEALSVPEYETSMNALVELLEPKAVMMSDIFPNHWAYRISRNKAQKLLSLDENRRPLEMNSYGPANHRVTALPEKETEPLVYFKANGNPAIQPEKEYMLYSLYKQLQIPVPETALLVLTDVFENNSDCFYAVQASEAVIGTSAQEACRNDETILEQGAYASQVIGALLTSPSDGSFKNFKYSPQYKTLISIDNDLIFRPEFNVKSILYLLPQMDLAIPKATKTLFTTLDPNLTILSWLQDLSRKNKEYSLLFSRLAFQNTRCIYQNLTPQSEFPSLTDCIMQKTFVDPDLHSDSFDPQILVSEALLNNVSEKLQTVKRILLNNHSPSTQILFEGISPILGKHYRKLRAKFSDPEKALDVLWGENNYFELNPEESDNKVHDEENILPEAFFKGYKSKLTSAGEALPLDNFIQRHCERKNKNLLNLTQALKELQVLTREGFTNSESPRDIVDFCYNLSNLIDVNRSLIKEITCLLSSLPHSELQWLFTLEKYFQRIASSSEPPSVSKIHGAFLKQRIFNLTKPEKEYLFDQQGNIDKHFSLTGRSKVTHFPEKSPIFYLKQYPEMPGYEFASTLFMRLLGVTRLPYQDLIIINSKYPVLLTQAVHGDPVFRIWQKPEAFNNLDPFHTGLLIIAAMLLNPEDGKEDNFILSPDGEYLIPIDNDHCFLPSTFQKGKFYNMIVNTALQTKTLLFCLDEMNKPIPNEVKQHIISLNFDSLLTTWLQELAKIDDRYHHLVDEKQREIFLEKGTVLRIPFYEQYIHNLYWKVNKIQDLLRSPSEPTPFDLLKAVEPFAARCYQESFKHGDTLQSRFMAATDQLYIDTMGESRTSVLNTQIMMKIINVPVKNLQNEAWPSEALETLEKLIKERSQNRKLEQELLCELDDKTGQSIWTILFGNPLLETALNNFFANPKEGLVLKGSKLITSSNLRSLFAQTPDQGTKVKFLSLPNSPLLDGNAISVLVEGCPNLEYLNVNGCLKLEEVVTTIGEWSLLTRVEAKDCLNMIKFISCSPIRILRIGTNQKIEICIERSVLNIFTISTKTNHFDFSLTKEGKFEIKPLEKDQSADGFLQNLMLDKAGFEKYFRNPKITIGTHSVLTPKDLAVFITSLDLIASKSSYETFREIIRYNFINLEKLQLPFFNIEGNTIFQDLVQGNWPKLIQLNVFENDITDEGLMVLSQGNWPLLEVLNLKQTEVTTKGLLNFAFLTKWQNLREITFSLVLQAPIDFPNVLLQNNWHLLFDLDLSSSKLTQTEIEMFVKRSKWPRLKSLNMSDNEITDEGFVILSQGNWPELEKLNLIRTKVTNKGFLQFYSDIKWPKLQEIALPGRVDAHLVSNLLHKRSYQVERLGLENLELGLAEIKLIVKKYQFQGLKHLDLSNNKIFDEGVLMLTLAKWPSLEHLHVENTSITSKGIENMAKHAKWKKLKYLNLSNNQISDEGVSFLAQPEWPLLEELNLTNTSLTSKGIEMISKKSKWKQLKSLNLSENKVSDEGVVLIDWPLLENLHLQNTNITSKAIKTIVTQLKWSKFKYLDLSNNAISDEGISLFTHTKWPCLEELHLKNTQITINGINTLVHQINFPQLKKLDISHNTVQDEGLEILASAEWPLFQHLVYYETQVTLKGNIALLENMKWQNLSHLEHSFAESFYNYNKNLNKCYLPETILTLAPILDETEPILTTVLDTTWLNSKKINLSIRHKGRNQKVLILPRDKLDQLKEIRSTEFYFQILRFAIWPPNLRKIEISNPTFFDEETLQLIFSQQCPLLEDLNLENAGMTAKFIQVLIHKNDWFFLKKLCLSHNKILDEGLQLLLSKKWPELESLNLRKTGITADGIKTMIVSSKWPKLKTLDISGNLMTDTGLEALSPGIWPLLENFDLRKTRITKHGIESMANLSKWHNLKTLDVSHHYLYNEGLQTLSSGRWPQLESLNLRNTCITSEGIKSLVNLSEWPYLKSLDLSDNEIHNQGLAFLSSAKWPLFENLTLRNTFIKGEGIRSLVDSSDWPNLKTLELSKNYIFYAGLKFLFPAKWPLLESLSLRALGLETDGVEGMVSISAWSNLKVLDISDNYLYDEGLKILSSGKWPWLEDLTLKRTFIKETGIESMVKISKWPNLKVLDLSYNEEVSDSGLKVLATGKWPLLENLKIIKINITFMGIKRMIETAKWPNLKEIHLMADPDSSESFAIKQLTEAKWPRCIVVAYQ